MTRRRARLASSRRSRPSRRRRDSLHQEPNGSSSLRAWGAALADHVPHVDVGARAHRRGRVAEGVPVGPSSHAHRDRHDPLPGRVNGERGGGSRSDGRSGGDDRVEEGVLARCAEAVAGASRNAATTRAGQRIQRVDQRVVWVSNGLHRVSELLAGSPGAVEPAHGSWRYHTLWAGDASRGRTSDAAAAAGAKARGEPIVARP